MSAAPEAPCLVFVHGLGASRQDWAEAFAVPELGRYTLLAGPALPRVYVAPGEALRLLAENHLELELFPDAGHAVMIDEPIVFYAFLARWAASAVR